MSANPDFSEYMNLDALTFAAGEPLTEARGMLDSIRIGLNWVHLHRKLFWDVIHELDRDGTPTSPTWRAHYAQLYVDGQSMAVRRLIGGNEKHEACLTRLLSVLHDNGSTITIDRLGEISAAAALATKPEGLARHCASVERQWGDGSGHLASDRIDTDLATLRTDTARVRRWATRTIAHNDFRGADVPSFSELDEAIGDVTGLFRWYGMLLTGVDLAVDENEPDLSWREPLKSLFQQREEGKERSS